MNPVELDRLIAGNVRAIRAKLQIRQEDLADDLGWTRAMVGKLENGKRRVTFADVVSLCEALDVDLWALLAGEDDGVLRKLGVDRRA